MLIFLALMSFELLIGSSAVPIVDNGQPKELQSAQLAVADALSTLSWPATTGFSEEEPQSRVNIISERSNEETRGDVQQADIHGDEDDSEADDGEQIFLCPKFSVLPVPCDLILQNTDFNPSSFVGHSAEHGAKDIAEKVTLIGNGEDGCAYLLEDGDDKLIAKTMRRPGRELSVHEISALIALGEYYGTLEHSLPGEEQARHFYYEKYHSGVHLYDTIGWRIWVSSTGDPDRELGKSVSYCHQFLREVRDVISILAGDYVRRIGYFHNDLHYGNIRFPDSWSFDSGPMGVSFIDWGDAVLLKDVDKAERITQQWLLEEYQPEAICA